MMQATSRRTAAEAIRGVQQALERRIRRHGEMASAAAAETNSYRRRSLEIDAEEEGRLIKEQKRRVENLRRRAGQQ